MRANKREDREKPTADERRFTQIGERRNLIAAKGPAVVPRRRDYGGQAAKNGKKDDEIRWVGVMKVDGVDFSGRSDGPTGIYLRTSALICGWLLYSRLSVACRATGFASADQFAVRFSGSSTFHLSLFTNH